jgi:hypothetical protein
MTTYTLKTTKKRSNIVFHASDNIGVIFQILVKLIILSFNSPFFSFPTSLYTKLNWPPQSLKADLLRELFALIGVRALKISRFFYT